jgi:hypothetical protein
VAGANNANSNNNKMKCDPVIERKGNICACAHINFTQLLLSALISSHLFMINPVGVSCEAGERARIKIKLF